MGLLADLLALNASPSVAPPGMQAGNIRIDQRPTVPNEWGSTSSVLSMGIGEGDPRNPTEVVIPRVVGNAVVSPDEAIKHYSETGEHLGKFEPTEEWAGYPMPPPQRTQASEYGRLLHEDQEALRFGGGYVTPSAENSLSNILRRGFGRGHVYQD